MPQALGVRPPDSSERSKRAARVAERTFLRQRIHNSSLRLAQIRKDIQQLDDRLDSLLPPDTLPVIRDVVRQRALHQNDIVKQRQQKKFDKLFHCLNKEATVQHQEKAIPSSNP
ncbi:hypothetical protein P879_06660 [Paragonimus westermani]|uniref:Uncharacterized protein n=1 Tax=Paragonimus westermani TaxID=34504 RepID=A0A8T0DK67_9TREM|nr:hypothetical protein P879_06660 [Paragonimus westermani]